MKLLKILIFTIIFPNFLWGKIELTKKNNFYCNDGDTCYAYVWYKDLSIPKIEKLRIIGLDTPEIYRSECAYEKNKGLDAKKLINLKIQNSTNIQLITDYDRDNFGRILVRLIIDDEDISDLMISNGLGVPYNKKNKFNWCDINKNK
tara:strand:+ start:289 stop:729 length:441 start_codon:yes stop_codon:yes gene_type:complete